MNQRQQHLTSIATTIADYRAGEIPTPTYEHVDRWVSQFAPEVQLPLLAEMDHVLARTYINKQTVEGFLANLVRNPDLAGADFCAFWKNVEFLDIQQGGNSQHEMLAMFDAALQRECSFPIQKNLLNPHTYIYLDDGLFSGSRIKHDLEPWIKNDAPIKTTLHVIVIVKHTGGSYFTETNLKKLISTIGKNIDLHVWSAISIENTKYRKNTSEVLWPHLLPEDEQLATYTSLEQRFPFEPRVILNQIQYQHKIFSSEGGRQLLERELLLAGVRIRSSCQNPKTIMRPLGFGSFGLGFGSTVVTFRNCPNNAPLALWWGDPTAYSGSPLRNWYPLFPRKTYSQNAARAFEGIDWSEFGL